LKKEISDLYFVNYDFNATSRGQSTDQDSVKKILSMVHLLALVLPAAHSVTKKLDCSACFFHKNALSMGHLISVYCLVHQFIGIKNDSN